MTTCSNCGSDLHEEISTRGVRYWASNSGFCPWPADYVRHDPEEVTL